MTDSVHSYKGGGCEGPRRKMRRSSQIAILGRRRGGSRRELGITFVRYQASLARAQHRNFLHGVLAVSLAVLYATISSLFSVAGLKKRERRGRGGCGSSYIGWFSIVSPPRDKRV